MGYGKVSPFRWRETGYPLTSGHTRFEHAAESDTDDILLSLACALWYVDQGRPAVLNIVQ